MSWRDTMEATKCTGGFTKVVTLILLVVTSVQASQTDRKFFPYANIALILLSLFTANFQVRFSADENNFTTTVLPISYAIDVAVTGGLFLESLMLLLVSKDELTGGLVFMSILCLVIFVAQINHYRLTHGYYIDQLPEERKAVIRDNMSNRIAEISRQRIARERLLVPKSNTTALVSDLMSIS